MKCHYEILEVPRDASNDDLKKAYRKLALKWHPDKNLDKPVEAKEYFQFVQQAWEVLSDPHERAWYDNHREAILKGGIGDDYKDDSIDLFQFFSTGCFKGYNDDEKGFYTIYKNVFEKLSAEDAEFAKEGDSDEEVPSFGNSQSSYEDVVHPFYAYWQSYSTKRSFAWLDTYDIRDAPNRRVVRLIEKENKKVQDKAKRERNEQVRNLVAFVRKRDKRVQAHAEKLAEKAKENAKKVEERKRQQLRDRQKELKEHKVSEWSKFTNVENELKHIEANLAAEFGHELSSDSDDNSDDISNLNALYCVACNKIFKTQKAFTNHENSKKHKDNIIAMKAAMIEDDEEFNSDSENSDNMPGTSGLDSKEKNLATGPEMPDFLLQTEQQSDVENGDDGSDSEFISDNEDDDDDDDSIVRENKINGKGKKRKEFHLKENNGVDGSEFIWPKASEDSSNLEKNEEAADKDELMSDQEDDEDLEDEEEILIRNLKKKKKKGKSVSQPIKNDLNNGSDDNDDDDGFGLDLGLSKKQRKKRSNLKKIMKGKIDEKKTLETLNDNSTVNQDNQDEENKNVNEKPSNDNADDFSSARATKTKGKKAKEMRKAQKQTTGIQIKNSGNKKGKKLLASVEDDPDVDHSCVTCKSEFSSKNKLFDHLKKTGHSVHLPSTVKSKSKKSKNNMTSDSDD